MNQLIIDHGIAVTCRRKPLMTQIIEHRQDAAPDEQLIRLRVWKLRDGDGPLRTSSTGLATGTPTDYLFLYGRSLREGSISVRRAGGLIHGKYRPRHEAQMPQLRHRLL
jgi:hypothetical protein